MNFINQELYDKILENIPIICVDGIVLNKENQILFLKRLNEPEKDKWWFPGGRVVKNEKLSDSIVRKIKQETSIDSKVVSIVGITETIFETGPNKIPVHTINVTFLLEIVGGDVQIDLDHSEYIWTSDISNLDLHTELKKILKKI